MQNALLTGFSAYAGMGFNTSEYVVKQLNGRDIGGVSIFGSVLPVAFGTDWDEALKAIEKINPSFVLATGLDPDADVIYFEEVAVNCRQIDESSFETREIFSGEPEILHAQVEVLPLAIWLNKRGLPARTRKNLDSAYLCNHLYYHLLRHGKATQTPVIFVHLPLPAEEGGRYRYSYLEVSKVVTAIEEILTWLSSYINHA